MVCSGPFRGKQFTYALVDERVPKAKKIGHEEALALLAERFFISHGPALLKDFTWWSGLSAAESRHAVELVKHTLHSETINGQQYWFKENKQASASGILLLSLYDEYIIAYSDYSPLFRDGLVSKGIFDNVGLQNVILKDGYVIGNWRRILKPSSIVIEVTTKNIRAYILHRPKF